ncbi:unnamed protein product [Cochlearia groenlandica]
MAPQDKHLPSPKPISTSKPNPTILPPPRHHPHRPQQLYSDQQQRRRRPSNRRICCCCCFWTILLILITLLLSSLLAIGLYLIYRPLPPSFSVASLRIHRLNLTVDSSAAAARLTSLFNFTLLVRNTNSRFAYEYDPFSISVVTDRDEILLGNGTLPGFYSGETNLTSFKGVVAAFTAAREVDYGDISRLRSDLKRRNGFVLKILMDTKVKIVTKRLKSKKIGIRVACDEIKGFLPKGNNKVTSLASTDKSKCKVEIRIKIWNWSF